MKKVSLVISILAVLLALILTTISLATASGNLLVGEAATGVWEKTTVDSDGNNGVSLAVDSANAPHVSYLADDADGGTQDFLKYAVKQNDVWTISQVSDQPVQTRGNSSLILDTNDSPHIAFGLVGTVNATAVTTVTHAFNQGGSWSFENIDVSETPGCCADHYRGILLSDSSDTLHLFYYVTNGAYSERQFKYARRVGSNNWQVTTLFGNAAVSLFSVDIDSEDNFHLVYKTQNEDIDSLHYSKFSSIDQFSPEVIYTQDDGRAVANMSITVDNSDTPYIVFAADGQTGGCNAVYTLNVAHQEANVWSIEAINSRSHARNALVFDSQNVPHVFSLVTYGCTYSTTTYVEYYYKTQDGWQEESLGSKYNTSNISFALDELDNFHGTTIGVYTGTAWNAWLTYHYKQSNTFSSISGTVTDTAGNPIPNATVSSSTGHNIITDASGAYTIIDLAPGNYTITVEKEGYTFSPTSRAMTVPPDASGQNFTGSPNADQDTDGDGLFDNWEINGYDHDGDGVIDVDLPAMGADPHKPDIFVEVDWRETDEKSQKPSPEALQKVVQAFANAPVYDESGNLIGTGINLHIDVGPDSTNYVTGQLWGANGKGNPISEIGEIVNFDDQESLNEINQAVEDNFSEARRNIFHYSLWISRLKEGEKFPSGVSAGNQGDWPVFLVSLGGWTNGVGSVSEQAGTFMHELGHNLGLKHGGDQGELFNYKPNYLSVMNYSFQQGGLIISGADGCDECFDYSRFELPSLNETELHENIGLNGGNEINTYGTKYRRSAPWLCWPFEENANGFFSLAKENANNEVDWSCNWLISSNPVQEDVNGMGGNAQTLTGYNDWLNLDFNYAHRFLRPPLDAQILHLRASSVAGIDPSLVFEELTLEEDRVIPRISETRAQVIGAASPGSVAPLDTLTFTVTVYTVDFGSVQSFVPTVSLPSSFSYVSNSTSGYVTANPVISGNQLTWPSLEIPDNTTVRQFSFQVRVGTSEGAFDTNFSGTSSTGLVLPDFVEIQVQSEKLFLPLVVR